MSQPSDRKLQGCLRIAMLIFAAAIVVGFGMIVFAIKQAVGA